MDKFKDIEKLLNASQRKGPVLESQEKQALWQEIQRRQNHEDTKELEEHEGFWKQWKVWTFGLATVAMCILLAYIIISENTKTKQLALQTSFVPRIYTKNITDQFSPGAGGNLNRKYTKFKFTTNSLSRTKPNPHPTINVEYKYNDTQIEKIVEIFGFKINEFKQKKNNIPKEYDMEICYDYRYNMFDWNNFIDQMGIDRCVSIDNTNMYDQFNLEQKTEKAKKNGIKEAKEYMTAITGYNINDLYIKKQWWLDHPLNNEDLIEYDIYNTQNLLDSDVPFYAPPWHAGIDNGKLYSLTGPTISIVNTNNKKIYLISPQDAYQRMRMAFQKNLEGTAAIQIAGPMFLESLIYQVDNKNVYINITKITLEYAVAQTKNDDFSKDEMILIPVYRAMGVEKHTKTPIEIYIDPSEDKSLFSDYSVVTF